MSVCVFVLIHLQEHFQIDAFSVKTLSVLVWMEDLNASKCLRFQNENLLFWTGSYSFVLMNAVFFFFQLVLVANELTLDKLLTAKSKSSSSLSPASSPRGWVCVYFMLFLFLQKIKPSFCALYVGNPQSWDKHYFNLRWGRLKLINYRTGTKPKL